MRDIPPHVAASKRAEVPIVKVFGAAIDELVEGNSAGDKHFDGKTTE